MPAVWLSEHRKSESIRRTAITYKPLILRRAGMLRLFPFAVLVAMLVSARAAPLSTAQQETSFLLQDVSSLKRSIDQLSGGMTKMQTQIKYFRSSFDGINALLSRLKAIPGQIAELRSGQDETSLTQAAMNFTLQELELSFQRANATTALQLQDMEHRLEQQRPDLSALKASQAETSASVEEVWAAVRRLEAGQAESGAGETEETGGTDSEETGGTEDGTEEPDGTEDGTEEPDGTEEGSSSGPEGFLYEGSLLSD
ncbi:uncharacterized protein LOC144922205 [Branchiostoma floridae x Branchiostoma belcheri]